MSRASRSLAFAALFVAACVGTNPDWDGPADDVDTSSSEDGDTSIGEASSLVTSGATSNDPASSSDASDDGDSDPTEVNTCIDGPPGAGMCPSGCSGGCSDGVCSIACEDKSCEDRPVECPDGWPCRVVCEGKDRCKKAAVMCPPMHACELECSGEHACEDLNLECGDGPCAMTCGDHPSACSKAVMACGAADGRLTCGQPQETAPTVQPSGDSACSCSAEGC